MTIRLTDDEVEEQYQEADEEVLQWDAADELDVTLKYDARFAQGWQRRIDLREGIHLIIDQSQSTDRTIVDCPEINYRNVRFYFLLAGQGEVLFPASLSETSLPYTSGRYHLRSNGLCTPRSEKFDTQPWSSVIIKIRPEILYSFTAFPERKIPESFQHLVRDPSQEGYLRCADTQPIMTTVLQQILHCPYQGMIKRAYLESKIIELLALVLDHEVAIQQGDPPKNTLKPEQLERVHYAKEILLRDLSNPPSLEELAHQAGLSEFMLRQGFRSCFDSTIVDMVRDHRLELAKQILAEQATTVAEVAYRVGYISVSYFSRAFKRKFGINPKAYQKICR
jgi:AraC-like DNA-binding protein